MYRKILLLFTPVIALAICIASFGSNMSLPQFIVYDLLYNSPFVIAGYFAHKHSKQGVDKGAWQALSLAMFVYAFANVLFDVVGRNPSLPWYLGDIFYLAFFVPMYIAIISFIKNRVGTWHKSMFLDGMIIALGVSTFVFAYLIQEVFSSMQGTQMQIYVYSAYPILDTALLVMILSGIIMIGHGLSKGWIGLVSGVFVLVCTDFAYTHLTAQGMYQSGNWLDIGWAMAGSLIGFATLQNWQSRGRSELSSGATMFWPLIIGSLVGIYMLSGVVGFIEPIPAYSSAIGIICFLLIIARTALSYLEAKSLDRLRAENRTDEITGLNNRRAYNEKIATMTGSWGLILIDLDGFKAVNDAFGHVVGDELLKEVGKRLDENTSETCFVSRLSGDEFALIVPKISPHQAKKLAHTLHEQVTYPFKLSHSILEKPDQEKPEQSSTEKNMISARVNASFGVAVAPRDGNVSMMIRCAENAMYRAKSEGTAGVQMHEPNIEIEKHSIGSQLELTYQLSEAIKHTPNQIVLHYQPIIKTSSDELNLEALVRWEHPEHGLIYPDNFITLAEQAGLMQELTDVILRRAIKQCARQNERGHRTAISVNLAASSLIDPTLYDTVSKILEHNRVPAKLLHLEITESMIITDPKTAARTVQMLRDLGVRVMVDDYGTGYSSISHLHNLKLDGLKIDRSFIMNMEKDPAAKAIVEATIRMAHALNMQVVAEGVEEKSAYDFLTGLGCDYLQGYHISRPMPEDKLDIWLTHSKEAKSA